MVKFGLLAGTCCCTGLANCGPLCLPNTAPPIIEVTLPGLDLGPGGFQQRPLGPCPECSYLLCESPHTLFLEVKNVGGVANECAWTNFIDVCEDSGDPLSDHLECPPGTPWQDLLFNNHPFSVPSNCNSCNPIELSVFPETWDDNGVEKWLLRFMIRFDTVYRDDFELKLDINRLSLFNCASVMDGAILTNHAVPNDLDPGGFEYRAVCYQQDGGSKVTINVPGL